MIKTIGNNISYKDTTCSAEAELNQIVNPAHGDCAYVIETQKNYMFDGATLQWVEQKKKESDVTRDEFEDLVDKVDDLQLFKFPNATIVGEPTINNGQISGFSENNYLKFPFLVDFKNKPFTIVMDFTTGANVTNQENIFDSDFGLAFAIRNENFVFAVSSNGTSWNIGEGVGTYTVSPNTTYRVKLAWNGSEYTLAYSLDGGKNYITDITKSGTVQPYPTQIYIGIGEDHAAVLNYFTGIINFNYAELYIDNILVWTGIDDVGLASRLATDVSNIDEAGIEKIKEIAKVDLSAYAKSAELNETNERIDTLSYGENAGGKNLFDDSSWVSEDNKFNATTEFYIEGGYKDNTIYTISCDIKQNSSGSYSGLSVYYTDGTIDNRVLYNSEASYKRKSYTTKQSKTVLKIMATDGNGTVIKKGTMQIEEGSTVTDYVPYVKSSATLTDEITRKEIELAELKTLGWTIPSSPFNNSVKGNRFTQNVDRVRFDDLEALGTFGTDNHCFRFRTPTGIKKEWVVAVYIDGYKSTFPRDYAGWQTEDDRTVGLLSTYDVICMKDNSCTTSDEFVAKLTGKYIYYLLATPITKQIDGSEIVENLTDQGLINKAVWHQGSINYSSGAIVDSTTAIYSDEIPCKQGDLISVANMENAGENIVMVYYNDAGYVGKSIGKLQFIVPANVTKFRANYRKKSNPNSNAKVYLNNKIEKLTNDIPIVHGTITSGETISRSNKGLLILTGASGNVVLNSVWAVSYNIATRIGGVDTFFTVTSSKDELTITCSSTGSNIKYVLI